MYAILTVFIIGVIFSFLFFFFWNSWVAGGRRVGFFMVAGGGGLRCAAEIKIWQANSCLYRGSRQVFILVVPPSSHFHVEQFEKRKAPPRK